MHTLSYYVSNDIHTIAWIMRHQHIHVTHCIHYTALWYRLHIACLVRVLWRYSSVLYLRVSLLRKCCKKQYDMLLCRTCVLWMETDSNFHIISSRSDTHPYSCETQIWITTSNFKIKFKSISRRVVKHWCHVDSALPSGDGSPKTTSESLQHIYQ